MTFYDTLINKNTASTGSLVYNSGLVSMNVNGVVTYLEIGYTGSPYIESLLPKSYHIFLGETKIIILLFGDEDLPEELFKYKGLFKITSVFAKNIEGQKVSLSVKEEGLRTWDGSETNWEDATFNWDSISFYNNPNISKGIKGQKSLLSAEKRVSQYHHKIKRQKTPAKSFKSLKKPIVFLINERKFIKEEKKKLRSK